MAADKHFDVRPFITGAKAAYETVVTAYADGDRRTLTNLLAPDVYEGFEAVIRERKDRGETAATRFLSIDATHITAAEFALRVELNGFTVQERVEGERHSSHHQFRKHRR